MITQDQIDFRLSRYKDHGALFAIEGGDGAGKTTFIRALEDLFHSTGIETVYVRNPGCDRLTNKIREITKKYKLNYSTAWLTYTCLFGAALNHTMQRVVLPALRSNAIVFMDRFIRSTYIYQMFNHQFEHETNEEYFARRNLFKTITESSILEAWTKYEFKEFVLMCSPKIAWERIHGRVTEETEDVWESQGYDYFASIHDAYIESVDCRDFIGMNKPSLIDASTSTEDMLEQAWVRL